MKHTIHYAIARLCPSIGLALLAVALTACDSRTASLSSTNSAAIHWDEIAANTDVVGNAPKNASLIFMR
jgi:hypothetical protein